MNLKQNNEVNFNKALDYLYYPEATEKDRKAIKAFLNRKVIKYGVIVNSYPIWHPFVSNQDFGNFSITPNRNLGYYGLDHTIYLKNAFITCPYGKSNVEAVMNSVSELKENVYAEIEATEIESINLYDKNASPILVTCTWDDSLLDKFYRFGNSDEIAIPLFLESELANWFSQENAKEWNVMKPYLLGKPVVKNESPFVTQNTGRKIEKLYKILCDTGMFGEIE